MTHSKEISTKAVNEYKNGSISAAIIAKYDIPGSTIRNHKSDPKLRIGVGRPTLLPNEQEQYLVELLKHVEVIGVRLTKSLAMKLASEYVRLKAGIVFSRTFLSTGIFSNIIHILKVKVLKLVENDLKIFSNDGKAN